jgi:hypothetical protein
MSIDSVVLAKYIGARDPSGFREMVESRFKTADPKLYDSLSGTEVPKEGKAAKLVGYLLPVVDGRLAKPGRLPVKLRHQASMITSDAMAVTDLGLERDDWDMIARLTSVLLILRAGQVPVEDIDWELVAGRELVPLPSDAYAAGTEEDKLETFPYDTSGQLGFGTSLFSEPPEPTKESSEARAPLQQVPTGVTISTSVVQTDNIEAPPRAATPATSTITTSVVQTGNNDAPPRAASPVTSTILQQTLSREVTPAPLGVLPALAEDTPKASGAIPMENIDSDLEEGEEAPRISPAPSSRVSSLRSHNKMIAEVVIEPKKKKKEKGKGKAASVQPVATLPVTSGDLTCEFGSFSPL